MAINFPRKLKKAVCLPIYFFLVMSQMISPAMSDPVPIEAQIEPGSGPTSDAVGQTVEPTENFTDPTSAFLDSSPLLPRENATEENSDRTPALAAIPPKLVEPPEQQPQINFTDTPRMMTQENTETATPPEIPDVPEEGLTTYTDSGVLTYQKYKYSWENGGSRTTTVSENRWDAEGNYLGGTWEYWTVPYAEAGSQTTVNGNYTGSDSQYAKYEWSYSDTTWSYAYNQMTYDSHNAKNVHRNSERYTMDWQTWEMKSYHSSESLNWYTEWLSVTEDGTRYETKLLEKWNRSVGSVDAYREGTTRQAGYRWTYYDTTNSDGLMLNTNTNVNYETFTSSGSWTGEHWNETLSESAPSPSRDRRIERRITQTKTSRDAGGNVTEDKMKDFYDMSEIRVEAEMLSNVQVRKLTDWHDTSQPELEIGYEIYRTTNEDTGGSTTTKVYLFYDRQVTLYDEDRFFDGLIKRHGYTSQNRDENNFGNYTDIYFEEFEENSPGGVLHGYRLNETQYDADGKKSMHLNRTSKQIVTRQESLVEVTDYIARFNYTRLIRARPNRVVVAFSAEDSIFSPGSTFSQSGGTTEEGPESMSGPSGDEAGINSVLQIYALGNYSAEERALAAEWKGILEAKSAIESDYFSGLIPFQSFIDWLDTFLSSD